MTVTKVVANSILPQDRGICGEFTVTLDDALRIHKILVVNGEKGLFVTYPNMRGLKSSQKPKRYVDVVHPITETLRQHIQQEVLKRYEEETAQFSK